MSGLTGNNILAGSSGQGGYEIEQSLRFEDTDAPYLTKTGASIDSKTFTLSAWIKRNAATGAWYYFSSNSDTAEKQYRFGIDANRFYMRWTPNSSGGFFAVTNRVARDVAQWYHVVWVIDTTESVSTDRIKLYVNGEQETSWSGYTAPSQNQDVVPVADSPILTVGAYRWLGSLFNYFDGYIAEMHYIDGQALDASNFGETDLLTNQWIPKKYVGTYGTNGFYLNFSDSGSLGTDSSGNGNNFTPTNLAATDQVLDSPTNNFATLDLLGLDVRNGSNFTLSEGNLKCTSVATTGDVQSSIGMRSGKWYAEVIVIDSVYPASFGVMVNNGTADQTESGTHSVRVNNNIIQIDLAEPGAQTGLSGISVGDIIGIAFNADTRSVQFYKNNSTYGTAETCPLGDVGNFYYFYFGNGTTVDKQICFNFGQDSSFAGNKTAQNNTDGNGKGDFYYAPPSGYLALCEDNLPDPSIALPGDHFNTVLYVSNNSTQSITGVGFQPDFTWHKNRTNSNRHALFDVVRGATNRLASNLTDAEVADADTLTSFDSDGFSIGADSGQFGVNYTAGSNFVTWCWKADNTSGSSNTDGTITSTVSANTTAGFSIVSYTGNGSANQTTGHGLSVKPELKIIKSRSIVEQWVVTGEVIGPADYRMFLQSTAAVGTASGYYPVDTSTTLGISGSNVSSGHNQSGVTYIAYCFHSVEGYSKIGSYTANGSADGPFVYTGFTPAFIIFKNTSAVEAWSVFDIKRNPINGPDANMLLPSSSAAESSTANRDIDFVSNGFKLRSTALNPNTASGNTYIYMAFAESPFKTSNAR